MSVHQVHVFVSHSWHYSGHYQTLREWIFDTPWSIGQASLNLRDYSVPKDDPIHNARTERELREAIYRKIERSHVIVIPTGMYANYSKWIGKEINGAKTMSKPILAVNPWGLRLAGRGEKIHEKVCRYGGRVPIREVWRARAMTAAVRRVLGLSETLGTCASSASNETRRS